MEQMPPDDSLILIEPNRRLLKAPINHIVEFYSPELEARIMSLPAHGDDARIHEELLEFRLPVFSGMYRNDELWLTIPDDTRSLRRSLRFVARDIRNYGEIFYKLGAVYRQLDETGIGFPQPTEERSVLESLVFSVDENEPYGGKIHLIPPYSLAPVRPEQAIESVALELEYSNVFSEGVVEHLRTLTEEGFKHG